MAKKKNTNNSSNNNNKVVPTTLVAAATAESIIDPNNDDDHGTTNATKGRNTNKYDDDTTTNTTTMNYTNTNDAATTTTEVYELLQVDLGDMIKVKQVLDECVAMILLDYLPENTHWDNFKLSIMTCACIAAMMAQLNQYSNITIPYNRMVLIVCGSIYFVCSTLLQYITTFIDQDTIIYTQPITEKTEQQRMKNRKNHLSLMMQMMSQNSNTTKSKSKNKSVSDDHDNDDDEDDMTANSLYLYYNRTTKTFCNPEPALPLHNPKLSLYGLRIRTTLPRFSQYYTVTFELDIPKSSSTSKSKSPPSQKYMVTKTWSIGQFFDHQGYFDEIGFANTIEELFIAELDAEQYTTTTTTTTTPTDSKKQN